MNFFKEKVCVLVTKVFAFYNIISHFCVLFFIKKYSFTINL